MLIDRIIQSGKTILTTHTNPDCDGIGSGLSFIESIKLSLDREITFVVKDELDNYFSFMPGSSEVVVSKEVECDLLIVVDSANLERTGLNIKCNSIVNIDHHISNTMFGDINIVDSEATSTCEIIFDIIKRYKLELNCSIASNIYSGILSDTGSFAWGNVTKDTFSKVSILKSYGIDHSAISKNLFYKKREKELRALGYALQNFIFLPESKMLYLILTEEIYRKYGFSEKDSSGIINVLKSFEDAEVTLLLKEVEDGFRGSLRSDVIDVNRLASIFSGGGHARAAGFVAKCSANIVVSKIESELKR